MIHNFYLLKKSGECVVHRKYGSLETDENLVTGFLSAMFSFGRNISGCNIESVLMEDKKFVYVINGDVILAAYADRDDMVKEKLELLSKEFNARYGNLEYWDGDRDKFAEFLPKLDEVLGSTGEEASGDVISKMMNNIQNVIQAGKESTGIKNSVDDLVQHYMAQARKINQSLPEQHKTNAEIPRSISDKVHFTVTAPFNMLRCNSYVLDVWAHLAGQRKEVIKRAKEAQGQEDIRIKSKEGVNVARGTILTVRLEIPDFIVEEPEDTILWDGDIGNASFPVTVPLDTNIVRIRVLLLSTLVVFLLPSFTSY